MYLTAVMAITTISIMMTVVVLNFHYRGPSKKPAPKWLKEIILNKMGYWFCCDLSSAPSTQVRSSDYQITKTWINCDHMCVDQSNISNHSMMPSTKQNSLNTIVDGTDSPTFCGHQSDMLKAGASEEFNVHDCTYHKDLVKILRFMVNKEEQEIQKNGMINEWRQMALVIDRVFFWLFLVAIVLSSFIFLVVVPFHRRDAVDE